MEKIELGQYTVATKWDEVTLEMWSQYMKKLSEKENNELNLVELLEVFSDIPHDVVLQMPQSLFEKVLNNLKFLTKEQLDDKPNNMVEIDGEKYRINTEEELKVQEYLDINTVIESDKFNYPFIFAILCRKENEEYNEDFKAKVFSERVDMFQKVAITKVFPLITFFLTLYAQSVTHSLNSSMVQDLKLEAIECVKNISNSLRLMDYITPSKVRAIMTLRKLRKSLESI